MSGDLAQLQEQLTRVEAKQDTILHMLNAARRPHLTVRAFAQAAGRSERYVFRLIAAGRIHKERGRIPAKYLENFTSKPTA